MNEQVRALDGFKGSSATRQIVQAICRGGRSWMRDPRHAGTSQHPRYPVFLRSPLLDDAISGSGGFGTPQWLERPPLMKMIKDPLAGRKERSDSEFQCDRRLPASLLSFNVLGASLQLASEKGRWPLGTVGAGRAAPSQR